MVCQLHRLGWAAAAESASSYSSSSTLRFAAFISELSCPTLWSFDAAGSSGDDAGSSGDDDVTPDVGNFVQGVPIL